MRSHADVALAKRTLGKAGNHELLMRVRVLSTSGIVLLALLLPPLAAQDARLSPDRQADHLHPPVGGQADDRWESSLWIMSADGSRSR